MKKAELEEMAKMASRFDKYKEFWDNPDKFLPIDELGDLYLQWFYNKYATLRMLKKLPLFEKAYSLLAERKNYSRKKAFGEMHCDGYLWIVKHPTVKVIIEERQSYKYIYIRTDSGFHIRGLGYEYNYPSHVKNELKGITIQKFRKQGFKPYLPNDVNAKRFGAFTYGDSRDDGYILSIEYLIEGMEGHEKIDYANAHTLSAIESMKFWEVYVDDPTQLE